MKQIQFSLSSNADLNAFDTLILPVFDKGQTTDLGTDTQLATLTESLFEQGDFLAKPGQTQMVFQPAGVPCRRVLLVASATSAN